MALITDLQHYLNSNGTIPESIPGPARNIALFLGSIAGWITSHPIGTYQRTNVPCRRSAGRRRCSGAIHARFESDGSTIIWQCPNCSDYGTIRGWEGTLWDRSKG